MGPGEVISLQAAVASLRKPHRYVTEEVKYCDCLPLCLGKAMPIFRSVPVIPAFSLPHFRPITFSGPFRSCCRLTPCRGCSAAAYFCVPYLRGMKTAQGNFILVNHLDWCPIELCRQIRSGRTRPFFRRGYWPRASPVTARTSFVPRQVPCRQGFDTCAVGRHNCF
jgi:hypothetical protein